MNWVKWLKERMDSDDRKKIPEDARLMDEVYALYRIATEAAEVEMPAIRRFLQAESIRIHKSKMGNRALDPDEIVLRAKCIASVDELMAGGMLVEDARNEVTRLSSQDRKKVARWHQEFDPTPVFNGEIRYRRTLPDKVEEIRTWIQRQHNQMITIDAIKNLFES